MEQVRYGTNSRNKTRVKIAEEGSNVHRISVKRKDDTGVACRTRIISKDIFLSGELELTNNRAERAVKPFVIGRKNWLFADTEKGADASARCYSIIESAKLNDLNVFGYLTHLLTELPKLGEDPKNEQIDSLMPWPEYCR